MNKEITRWLLVLMAVFMSVSFVSCGDDDEPTPPGATDSGLNDPAGTVQLSMDNNKKTQINRYYSLCINNKNNFYAYYGDVATVGKVNGINDIRIPSKGWKSELKVNVGHGYVYREEYLDRDGMYDYYLIYVVSEITDASGNITGFKIKFIELDNEEAQPYMKK